MPWFRVDDSFYRHRKVRKLGRDKAGAVGLWLLCGAWCAENLTDGFVPAEQVELWDGPRRKYARRLVEVGFWHEAEQDGETGYQFHDWADYQPTRASVEADREAWRAKKAEQRERKRLKASRRVSPGDTREDTTQDGNRESRESPALPVPGPVPGPGSGYLGEGVSPAVPRTNPHPQRPPEHCEKHPGGTDQPCGQCADARRAAEQWDADDAARREQIADDIERARLDRRLECEHGTPGGLFTHPVTGLSATCAQCRSGQRQAAS